MKACKQNLRYDECATDYKLSLYQRCLVHTYWWKFAIIVLLDEYDSDLGKCEASCGVCMRINFISFLCKRNQDKIHS